MPVLGAAVAVLTVLVFANLLLTAAVIRKLRHGGLPLPAPGGSGGLSPGSQVPAFSVTDQDGKTLTSDDLAGRLTALAFFSAHCEPCLAEAPRWSEKAEELSSAGIAVVTVVRRGGQWQDNGVLSLVPKLGRTVVEETPAVLQSVFRLTGTPAYALVGPDGAVVRVTRMLSDLETEIASTVPAGR